MENNVSRSLVDSSQGLIVQLDSLIRSTETDFEDVSLELKDLRSRIDDLRLPAIDESKVFSSIATLLENAKECIAHILEHKTEEGLVLGAKRQKITARPSFDRLKQTIIRLNELVDAHSSSTMTSVATSDDLDTQLVAVLTPKPLSDPERQIRLLQISDDYVTGDSLRFTIHIQRLEEAVDFVAISYTWGDKQDPQQMSIDGKKCFIRKNCHEALQQACAKLGSVQCNFIWVDSICIDQQNADEKGHQVSVMGDIYSRAAHVFACVGLHANQSEYLVEKALEVAEFEYPCPHDDFLCSVCRIPWENWALALKIEDLCRLCQSCQTFGDRGYWNRVWIIQEVAMAKSLFILCGPDMLPWRTLNNLEAFLGLELDEIPSVLEMHERLPDCGGNAMHDVFASRTNKIQLESIVSLYSRSRCSDPRDHLYGLLSLIDWPENMTPIFPDYHRSTFDLALQVYAYIPFEIIPDMLNLFGISSTTREVQDSVRRRRGPKRIRADNVVGGNDHKFKPLRSENGACTCGWIRQTEQGNLTADLVKGKAWSRGAMDPRSLLVSSSNSETSSDVDGSENLANRTMSFFSSSLSEREVQRLTLGDQIAGFLCSEAVVGDVLVPFWAQSGETYLVLRPNDGEKAEVIGQAILLPNYELGCERNVDDVDMELQLFSAQVLVDLSAEDAIVLFAQDVEPTEDYSDEEQHWRRVFTNVTLTHPGAALIQNQSRLRAKDIIRTRDKSEERAVKSLFADVGIPGVHFAGDSSESVASSLDDPLEGSDNS